MAAEVVHEVDFDIDSELIISDEILTTFNEYEDVEIDIEDDLTLEDLRGIEEESFSVVFPVLQFVDDNNVGVVTCQSQVEENKDLLCPVCSKKHKKITYLEKHAATCGMFSLIF